MALSDLRILEEIKKGSIVIWPFERANLSTSSYDVRLGEWYFRELKPASYRNIYNIYDREHTEEVWGSRPLRAKKASTELGEHVHGYSGIRPDDKIIILEPGETILAHTREFIGGRERVTTMMKARSTLGRNFIEVCKCAGWGDVGYINRWTMEVTNNSRHYSIPLVVGRRVAQIVFFETGPIAGADYSASGKYQQPDLSLAELKRAWNPSQMLPRMYMDKDIK